MYVYAYEYTDTYRNNLFLANTDHRNALNSFANQNRFLVPPPPPSAAYTQNTRTHTRMPHTHIHGNMHIHIRTQKKIYIHARINKDRQAY